MATALLNFSSALRLDFEEDDDDDESEASETV